MIRLVHEADVRWIGKIGGVLRYGTSYRWLSPGFDPTDIGFVNESNHRSFVLDVGLQSVRASTWYRTAGIQLIRVQWWSGSGQIDENYTLNSNVELLSQWRLFTFTTLQQMGRTYCSQRCTRGGPALRKDPLYTQNFEIAGDARSVVLPDIFFGWSREDGGRTRIFRFMPSVLVRAASNLQISATAGAENVINDTQFFGRYGAATSDTTHYTLAHLAGGTRSLTTRVSYAATPALSVEWYAQPYVSRGMYSSVRELNVPRSPVYDLRLKPYSDAAVTSAPGGVNFNQFRSNLVTRWEYRPGSVLFVVWSQGRDLSQNAARTLSTSSDARELFSLYPKNTVAVKASYWFSR